FCVYGVVSSQLCTLSLHDALPISFIGETVERMVACGERRVVAIVLAPHYSALSVGAYEKKLLDAARGRLDLALVRSWGDHPKFLDRKSTRLNSSHGSISYAVFCLK